MLATLSFAGLKWEENDARARLGTDGERACCARDDGAGDVLAVWDSVMALEAMGFVSSSILLLLKLNKLAA